MAEIAVPYTVIPGGYPPLYYPSPSVVPPVAGQTGLMYQPIGMRPGWRPNSFTNSSRPAFQPAQVPLVSFFII